MPFILSAEPGPRLLVINPNATEAFTQAMHDAISTTEFALDYFTAPADTAPASIEGVTDSILSAAACLNELQGRLDAWDGYIVACFSAHPLTHALRELTTAPVMSILESPLLFASTLGSRVGILTTSPRWEPLLTHDIASLHLTAQNAAGVVSSGLSVLELETRPRIDVVRRLCDAAQSELQDRRRADVIILGCAGMVGLQDAIRQVCRPGMVVLDPVQCAVEMCASLVQMNVRTSKVGIYAPA